MEDQVKVRVSGFVFCTLVLAFFSFQVYWFSSEWVPLAKIEAATECTQIFVLNLWELTQNLLWILALMFVLLVIAKPAAYRTLLVSLYFLGPVFFLWTSIALGFFLSFNHCCQDKKDGCIHFSDYRHADTTYGQLIVSLILSGTISIYLLCLMGQLVWTYIEAYLRREIRRGERLPPL